MDRKSHDVVTGAFSYTGRQIARLLLEGGHEVRTLTGRGIEESPFGDRVTPIPFNFDDPEALTASLEGVGTLYNTYWVRFSRGDVNFDRAVENSRILIAAAKAAGVERFVHVSITNPSEQSPLPYFRGKAQVERALRESGLSYGIVRPTVVFGRDDVFINNIAWLLRHFPFFGLPGDGRYGIQPVHVDDVAEICVDLGGTRDDLITDAAGPEVFTFADFVRSIARAVGVRRAIISTPPWMSLALARTVGLLVRDVVLNRQELEGLMTSLVVSSSEPAGTRSFSRWLDENASRLGRRYASEVARNYDRIKREGTRAGTALGGEA